MAYRWGHAVEVLMVVSGQEVAVERGLAEVLLAPKGHRLESRLVVGWERPWGTWVAFVPDQTLLRSALAQVAGVCHS